MEPNTTKPGFKLSKEDVWGKYNGSLMVSAGKLVARGIPDADGKYFTQKEFDRATSEIIIKLQLEVIISVGESFTNKQSVKFQ